MKILKYPPKVIHCDCGCVFIFSKEDVYAEERGILRDGHYVFFVDCPVCDESHILDSSKARKPYPIDNEGLESMCERVFGDLKGDQYGA